MLFWTVVFLMEEEWKIQCWYYWNTITEINYEFIADRFWTLIAKCMVAYENKEVKTTWETKHWFKKITIVLKN